jgi:hypothetical protein
MQQQIGIRRKQNEATSRYEKLEIISPNLGTISHMHSKENNSETMPPLVTIRTIECVAWNSAIDLFFVVICVENSGICQPLLEGFHYPGAQLTDTRTDLQFLESGMMWNPLPRSQLVKIN